MLLLKGQLLITSLSFFKVLFKYNKKYWVSFHQVQVQVSKPLLHSSPGQQRSQLGRIPQALEEPQARHK